MSDRFEMGEIAIFVREGSPHYGCEVTVVGPLALRGGIDMRTLTRHAPRPAYLVESEAFGPAPLGWAVNPEWLRKRRPPQDWVKLCSLDDIPREVSHV